MKFGVLNVWHDMVYLEFLADDWKRHRKKCEGFDVEFEMEE